MIPINKFYNDDVGNILPRIDELSCDLAIIDPPYFGIVTEDWGNQWDNLSDYLEWTDQWTKELYRVMRYSGTVYLYGCTKNLLTLCAVGHQLEKLGFEFRQEIIIELIYWNHSFALKTVGIFPPLTYIVSGGILARWNL